MVQTKYFFLTFWLVMFKEVRLGMGELTVSKIINVREGDQNVILDCPIVTNKFESVLWMLHRDHVLIGGKVHYDPDKYQYRASTGQLVVKEASFSDSGLYRCIVQSGDGQSTNTKVETAAVELIVKRTYANLWEEEIKENTVRAGVSAGLIVLMAIALCLVYKCRYKAKASSYDSYKRSVESGISPRDGGGGKDNQGMEITERETESEVHDERATESSSRSPDGELISKGELKPNSRRESTNSSFLRRLSNLTMNSNRVGSDRSESNYNAKETRVGDEGVVIKGPGLTSSMVSIGVNTDLQLKGKPGSTIIYVTAED